MGGSCALCTCLNTTTADASAAASAVNYKRRLPAGVCPVSQGVPLGLSPCKDMDMASSGLGGW